MLTTGKSEVLDNLWNNFWPSTHVKPIPVLQFIDVLLFCKQLDEAEIEKERANIVDGAPIKDPAFTPGQQHLRWSSFQQLHWTGLYKLFFRNDGVMQFVKRTPAYKKLPQLKRSGETFTPPAGMLVNAVQLVSKLNIVNDEQRAEIVDYLLVKARIPKAVPKSTSLLKAALKRQPPKTRRFNVQTTQVSKSFYLVLLSFFIGAFAASFAFLNWKKSAVLASNKNTPAYQSNGSEKDTSVVSKPLNQKTEVMAVRTAEPVEVKGKNTPVETALRPAVIVKEEKPGPLPAERLKEVAVNKSEGVKEVPAIKATENKETAKTASLYKIRSVAYFHNQPDEATRRKAFVNHWNNSYATLKALDEKNGFIYVVFHNDRNQTSKGWLMKKDLRPLGEDDSR